AARAGGQGQRVVGVVAGAGEQVRVAGGGVLVCAGEGAGGQRAGVGGDQAAGAGERDGLGAGLFGVGGPAGAAVVFREVGQGGGPFGEEVASVEGGRSGVQALPGGGEVAGGQVAAGPQPVGTGDVIVPAGAAADGPVAVGG